MQEVKLLSERQEVLTSLVENKIRLQSKATENYYETIFEELRELEEKKSKEALLLKQKKHFLIRYQSERDKAMMLPFSFEPCSSSRRCDMEEVSSESSRKICRTGRRPRLKLRGLR